VWVDPKKFYKLERRKMILSIEIKCDLFRCIEIGGRLLNLLHSARFFLIAHNVTVLNSNGCLSQSRFVYTNKSTCLTLSTGNAALSVNYY
jgi:hypothetical protein